MATDSSIRQTEQEATTQSIDANKELVRRFVQEIFVDGNADAVDELVSEDFVPHTWPSTGDGRGDLKRAIERVSKGLSDAAFTIEDMIAEADRVAVRLTAGARQTGEFMGIPPSGKSYTIGEIHIFRIRDGKVSEHWHQFDSMGMMSQLGALPGKS
jgi:steroid delta-isomerase-like uncharacterized protein